MAVASALIVGAAQYVSPEQTVKIEGVEPSQAKFGSSFEDLIEGVMTAEAINDVPLTPKPPADVVKQAEAVETPKPQTDEAMQPLRSTSTASNLPTPTLQTKPVQAAPSPDPILPLAVTPSPKSATPVTLAALAPKPPKPANATPATPPETLSAQEPDSTAPPLSARPQRRDPKKAAKVAAARPQAQKPKTKRAQQPKQQPRGNAQQNNTKGAHNGDTRQAKAATSGKGQSPAAKPGNATNSNYRGKVLRRLQRAGRVKSNIRATATVAFKIASNGRLERVSVAQSSGSAAFDQAALRQIKKASPFPKPPAGVDRNFSLRIKGN